MVSILICDVKLIKNVSLRLIHIIILSLVDIIISQFYLLFILFLNYIKYYIQNKMKNCDRCNVVKDVMLCGKCKTARYCSRECQIGDWKEHKKLCRMYVLLPDPILLDVTINKNYGNDYNGKKTEVSIDRDNHKDINIVHTDDTNDNNNYSNSELLPYNFVSTHSKSKKMSKQHEFMDKLHEFENSDNCVRVNRCVEMLSYFHGWDRMYGVYFPETIKYLINNNKLNKSNELNNIDEIIDNDCIGVGITNYEPPRLHEDGNINYGIFYVSYGKLACTYTGGEIDLYTDFFFRKNIIQLGWMVDCDNCILIYNVKKRLWYRINYS